MNKRITKHIALLLILLLANGSTLSLAATRGYSVKGKRPVLYPLIATKLPGSRNARPKVAARVQSTSTLPGQTATLLPDGRSLLIGGESDNGPRDGIAISDARTGEPVPIKSKLHHARAWHSATMLPDGRVLILGGTGNNGSIVRIAEIFDAKTQASTLLVIPEIAARAYHTATLLTDGQVLIVGGSSGHGDTFSKALLWDFKTRTFRTLAATLSVARQKHSARLLYDGNVLIQGGADDTGNPVTTAELFNSDAGNFNFSNISSDDMDRAAPFLAASLPASGASEVSVDTLISLRFSKPLRVETANAESFVLSGPEGTIETTIVPAEGGRLIFVTPGAPLLPGLSYTISATGAADESGKTISPAAVTFTTKTEPSPQVATGDSEDWIPDKGNMSGDWRSNRPQSPWQKLAPLEADPGVTALAGQVLLLNGNPLSGVTVQIGTSSTQTDRTGRFLLTSLTPGHHVLRLDGRSASTPGKIYGFFKIGVDVTDGRTNPLSFTIWMPRIDTRNAVNISVPTAGDVAITTPYIPGLEVHLPAGAIVRDVDGQTANQISITPIPVDRPPFPLPPNVNVPVFFTVQPGAAQVIPPRARVVYPNYTGAASGTRIDFWNYDPESKGWYAYGRGTVTPNGKQIVPDPGVVIYEFTGFMVSTGPGAPGIGPGCCGDGFGGGGSNGGGGAGGSWPGPDSPDAGRGTPGGGPAGPAAGPDRPKRKKSGRGGDPVDLATGLFVLDETDLYLPDVLPLALNRTYRPQDTASRPFGIGSTHPYEIYLIGDVFPYTYMDLILPDGGRVHFNRISPGTSWGDAIYEHTSSPSVFFKAKINWNGNGWDLKFKSGAVFTFPESFGAQSPAQAAVIAMRDRYGNAITFTRDANRNLTRLTSPNGRWMSFTYDASNRITQVRDNVDRTVGYTYDASGRLWKVTNPENGVTEYTYDAAHRLLTAKNERGIVYLTNEYDASGRVSKQILPDETPAISTDNPTYQFAYTVGTDGKITQTQVTDPRGAVRRVTFNADGYPLTDTYALGTPQQQSLAYERQAATNLILSETDHTGRKIAYERDGDGFITSVTTLFGTSEATTTTLTYEPIYKQTTSATGPLGSVSFVYDDKGNMIRMTDVRNQQTTFTYNSAGQLLSMVDPLGSSLQLAYAGGDLSEVTDAQGRVARRFVDGAGRLLVASDLQGGTVRYHYDALDQVTKIVDPLQGETLFAFDPDGNLLSVRDARGEFTNYTYDNSDRILTSTDSSEHVERYEYDKAGNVVKLTDRRGVVTTSSYDVLNRLTFSGFGQISEGVYQSTVTYTYDSLDRITLLSDSLAGNITRSYNTHNQLLSESSSQGSITYGYDLAGRLTSKTVTGQPAVTYTYDASNRLSNIIKGTENVTFTYDSASRPASLVLPNGVAMEYSYNSESILTGITYQRGATTLGNLAYTYDSLGRLTKIGGTFARTGLPQAIVSATYDETNKLVQWGPTTFTYDANGNLTYDGTRTYSWDARGQLSSVTGAGVNASFQYDGFGRRIGKTINGVTTNFFYDGLQVVQELTGGTPTNLLTGGIDQVFSRTDATGTQYLLTDFLGSTVALTDVLGTVQTEYSYDAFGQTTVSGASSTNSYQYTGRENDGATGLYYYRNRYYSPTLQRFISQDPLGFLGGINFYSYVENDPVNFIDPFGLDKKKRTGTKHTDDFGQGSGSNAGKAGVIMIIGAAIAAVAGTGAGAGAAGTAAGAAAAAAAPPIILGAPASSTVLATNMTRLGQIRPPGTAAHHIAPGRDGRFPGARESREILEKFDIDINDPANGVYLPRTPSSTAPGAYHPTLHTATYYRELYRLLQQATTRQQVIDTLNFVRQQLLKGTFPR